MLLPIRNTWKEMYPIFSEKKKQQKNKKYRIWSIWNGWMALLCFYVFSLNINRTRNIMKTMNDVDRWTSTKCKVIPISNRYLAIFDRMTLANCKIVWLHSIFQRLTMRLITWSLHIRISKYKYRPNAETIENKIIKPKMRWPWQNDRRKMRQVPFDGHMALVSWFKMSKSRQFFRID